MTYRERREAKAERLREWAGKREVRAAEVFKAGEPFTSDIAFNTQPGRIPFREKLIAREERAFESLAKAQDMKRRAAGIEAAAQHAIYSDDPDALEALEARIVELEAQRDAMKRRNAEFRKAHVAELKTMGAYERDRAMPHQGYELTNLSGNISRNRKRLASLQASAAVRDC
jgi:hypothetical protein